MRAGSPGFGGGLAKTRQTLGSRMDDLLARGPATAETWEALEELLLAADLGPATASALLNEVRAGQVHRRALDPA
ncbi:MAG: signal recognition particle receptor subunit alpha, partial [Candidatus Tectimicrobiota bacterium]